jgi:hypothetical protein
LRTSLLLQPRLPANQLISFWPSCMALAMLALNLPRSGLVQQPDTADGEWDPDLALFISPTADLDRSINREGNHPY